ncbi:hypothetical protein ACFTWH_08460 [Streptomyces sp. NPDC057011]|uniref:hypothetical protein n=1 Tax=unclassified Streptomyces TaxID=2593676 RepID=UPI0036379A98
MNLPEFLHRWWPSVEPIIDLTTPEARAEAAAAYPAAKAKGHIVDFHAAPQEPPRHRPRMTPPCPIAIIRKSDGARWS